MDATSENEPRKETHRLRILPWLTGLFIALSVYVLSIGPATWFLFNGDLSKTTFLAFYAPIIFVGGQSEIASRILGWYLDFWRPPIQ